MDESFRNQISEYKSLDEVTLVLQQKALSALCESVCNSETNNIDAMNELYIKIHSLLSVGHKLTDDVLVKYLNFFAIYTKMDLPGLSLVYVSKTFTLLLSNRVQSWQPYYHDLVMKIFSNMIFSGIDVVFHNVSECLLSILKIFGDFPVVDVAFLCQLSPKFHLILLKRFSSCQEALSFPDSFLDASFDLCLSNISERSSPNSVKVILWLFSRSKRCFDPNILFNDRNCFRNQSCEELFRKMFSQTCMVLEPDRKLCAHCLLSESEADFRDEVFNVYDLRTRCKWFKSLNGPEIINEWDLSVFLYSLLLDCTSEDAGLVESTLCKLSNLLANKIVLSEYLDCRTRLRGALILTNSTHHNFEILSNSLVNIILFSGFEDLKLAAYRSLQNSYDKLDEQQQLMSSFASNEWLIILRNFQSFSRASEDFLTSLQSANFSDITQILNSLAGLLLCFRIDQSIKFPNLSVLILRYIDHFYNLCNSETPESYTVFNTEDDYETRNEWKVVGYSAELLANLSLDEEEEFICKAIWRLQEYIANLKHRGAFTSLYEPLLKINTILYARNNKLIARNKEHIWELILRDTNVDVCTRRSAGLPLLLMAFLHSFPSSLKSLECGEAMDKLVSMSKYSESSIAQIRAVNIACELISDKSFGEIFSNHSSLWFSISFELLSSDIWGLRNVGLRLFSAIFKKEVIPKCDSTGKVDIRKVAPYTDVLLQVLRNPKESQHYAILMSLSYLRIPGQVRESLKIFINATLTFLKVIPTKQFYHMRLAENISSSFNLSLRNSMKLCEANSANSYPDFIRNKFVSIPYIRYVELMMFRLVLMILQMISISIPEACTCN